MPNAWLLVGLAALLVMAIPLVIAIRRSTELFVVRVSDNEPHFVRGRMPQRLLDDITDVVRQEKIANAEIRAVVSGGSPRVVGDGLSDGQLQRLRNVVGGYQVARIRAGGRPG